MNDLQNLFLIELRQVYDAEHQLAGALAELEKYATSKMLKLALGHHRKQTENHFKRLEKAFDELGESALRRHCQAVEGIIDEAQVLVMEFLGNPALDAALIAAGQKAEHYEITAYGTLCSWAKELGYDKVLSLLKDNLSEEKMADKALSLLAETACNKGAAKQDSPKRTDEEAEFLKAITHGP